MTKGEYMSAYGIKMFLTARMKRRTSKNGRFTAYDFYMFDWS